MSPTIYYILLTVALQFAVYNFQFFTDIFAGAALIALMFAAGFISTLLGSFWKGLRGGILYASPVLLLSLEIGELMFFSLFGSPDFFSTEFKSNAFIDLPDLTHIPASVGIQLFVCFMVSIGISMNKKFNKFTIRRGATDLDEVTKIFDWKEKIMPHEGDNVFKYQRLLKRAFTLVGVIRNDVVSSIHAVRIEDAMFFFDLFVIPERIEQEPSTGIWMVRGMLSRPELIDSDIKTVCALVRSGGEYTLEYYLNCGFTEMGEDDPELSGLKLKADKVLSEVYPDWKPLGGVIHYLKKEALDIQMQGLSL